MFWKGKLKKGIIVALIVQGKARIHNGQLFTPAELDLTTPSRSSRIMLVVNKNAW